MHVAVEAHSVWAASPVHLPHIRAHTRSWLASLAIEHATRDDIVLAVNEAATNSIEHAYTMPGPDDVVRLGFWTEPHHLYVEVADHGCWGVADPNAGYRGRGILLMHLMVASVAINRDVGGTRVVLRHPLLW